MRNFAMEEPPRVGSLAERVRQYAGVLGDGLDLSKCMTVQRASDITPQPIDWLWPGRLARGKMTLMGGDPGRSKSQLASAIAAIISRGVTGLAMKGLHWTVENTIDTHEHMVIRNEVSQRPSDQQLQLIPLLAPQHAAPRRSRISSGNGISPPGLYQRPHSGRTTHDRKDR
jgi:hypothetical protein